MNSQKRRAGGSYRKAKQSINLYAKEGKDRSKANKRKGKKK